MHCFQIWVTAWHANGDTNDPGGLGHSSSSWKLRSNSCNFLLLLERWMQPCVSQMKKFPVKWAVCCPRLLGDVSSRGSPSESLLTECPAALLCLHSANIPDTSPSFLGHGFSFPRRKLQPCVPSRLEAEVCHCTPPRTHMEDRWGMLAPALFPPFPVSV